MIISFHAGIRMEASIKQLFNNKCRGVFSACKRHEDSSVLMVARCHTSRNQLEQTLFNLHTAYDLVNKVLIKSNSSFNNLPR